MMPACLYNFEQALEKGQKAIEKFNVEIQDREIVHERAHFAFKDSENDTDPLIAEPRADKIALKILKQFHESKINYDFDNTKEIENFIKTSIRDDWNEEMVN